MCTIEIPYFKELIVMSFLCEYCGAHSTEVKPGGLPFIFNFYDIDFSLKKKQRNIKVG